MQGDVALCVRGENLAARLPRDVFTTEVSPMLAALVADREDGDTGPSAERDAQGRYILEGPTNPHAFSFLVECVRQGGELSPAEAAERLPDLAARLEACRHVDYYLLPGPTKMQLTKLLLGSFKMPELPSEVLDIEKFGLCRSEMILDRVHLEGLRLTGLKLDNCHIRCLTIKGCSMTTCEFAPSVTAGEVQVSSSDLEGVLLGMFAAKITIDDESKLHRCNIRVVEELNVSRSQLHHCTFQGSDEDRKERHVVAAIFKSSELYGDVRLPFDKITCEQTCFHGDLLRMTKGGASISFSKTVIRSLPSMESDTQVNLRLEQCDIKGVLRFHRMKLHLSGVRFAKPCEFVGVEFVEKVCDISFPRKTKFQQVRFKEGLHTCIASGCTFEGCNLGYGQDAVSGCLLTQCLFQSCRFPFLETNSPVANLSGCSFVACKIQWSGQFPHEESFVINSCWLRKWNLAGSTVSDSQ